MMSKSLCTHDGLGGGERGIDCVNVGLGDPNSVEKPFVTGLVVRVGVVQRHNCKRARGRGVFGQGGGATRRWWWVYRCRGGGGGGEVGFTHTRSTRTARGTARGTVADAQGLRRPKLQCRSPPCHHSPTLPHLAWVCFVPYHARRRRRRAFKKKGGGRKGQPPKKQRTVVIPIGSQAPISIQYAWTLRGAWHVTRCVGGWRRAERRKGGKHG